MEKFVEDKVLKGGILKDNFEHELLKPILSKSHGLIALPEQVMEIANKLAGYSKQESVIFSQLVVKGKASSGENKKEFVEGCLKNNISEDISSKIFDRIIESFSHKQNLGISEIFDIDPKKPKI